jgi:hypothetical protein
MQEFARTIELYNEEHEIIAYNFFIYFITHIL